MQYIIVDITARAVVALLYAMQILMFGRAIMSWFSPDEDSKISQFLYVVTEPFVYPIRKLLSRFDFFNNIPIDMSFMFAMVILIICASVLNRSLMVM